VVLTGLLQCQRRLACAGHRHADPLLLLMLLLVLLVLLLLLSGSLAAPEMLCINHTPQLSMRSLPGQIGSCRCQYVTLPTASDRWQSTAVL
jgi:hypothetical protein